MGPVGGIVQQAWIWSEFHRSLGMWLWASHLASQGASGLCKNWRLGSLSIGRSSTQMREWMEMFSTAHL